MLNIGLTELLVLLAFPLSGIAAGIYLAVSLRSNAERRRRQS